MAAKRYKRKLALLAKIETVYATDPVPTGMANAILATDVSITPMSANKVQRNLAQTYLGAQPSVLAGEHVEMKFKVEIAGAGAKGTAPGYGPLLRACGSAEVITADTKVEYSPVSGGYEAVSVYYYLDGTLYKFSGARGNATINLTPLQIPYFEFSLMGLQAAVSDAALPAQTLTGFKAPLLVSKTNTPTFSFHGYNAIAESFTFDLGQKVEQRFLIGDESMQITDRAATGSIVLEADSVAGKDWTSLIRARTQGALQIVHGVADGFIIGIDCPACEIDPLAIGDTQGILNNTLPFTAIPTAAGNDEWKITVR